MVDWLFWSEYTTFIFHYLASLVILLYSSIKIAILLLVDVNFSEMGLVLLGYVSLGKSQQFLDKLEPYKKKKRKEKDYVW